MNRAPSSSALVRVALFITCLNDTLFPETGIATVRVLERLGHEVEFPEAQTCCGQLHFNTGYQDEAVALARRFVHVFSDAEIVVAPSASCVAMVREFYPYLAEQADDAALAREVDAIAPRVMELTEFLVKRLSVTNLGASFPHRVTYHPTCHSLRVLHLGDAPLQLLRAVDGIDLVELPTADECCGFGGTFSIKNADTSNAILDDKLQAVVDTGANVVTAVDMSCLAQIGGCLSKRQIDVHALHIAEILAATT
jgi:L-lactate dehydrogenase complex protein LldE